MFVAKLRRRSIELSSLEDLQKALNRGKLDKNTLVIETHTGKQASVDEFLSGNAFRESSHRISRADNFAHELDHVLKMFAEKETEDFDDDDLSRLEALYKEMKLADIKGVRIDWDKLINFRKGLRRLQTAKRASLAEAERNAEDESKEFVPRQSYPQIIAPQIELSRRKIKPERQQYEQPQNRWPQNTHPETGLPQTEENEERPKPAAFFHSPFLVVMALIFIKPLGLIMLWTSPKGSMFHNIAVKVFLTVVFGKEYYYEYWPQVSDYLREYLGLQF